MTTTHWSQLEPLSNNKVSMGASGAPVNAADEGPIDEAEERRLFAEAVSQWRQQGGAQKVSVEREYDSASKGGDPQGGGEGVGEGDMWHNPFAVPACMDDSDDERSPAKASAQSNQKAAVSLHRHPPAPEKGGALSGGHLDEEKEHEVRVACSKCICQCVSCSLSIAGVCQGGRTVAGGSVDRADRVLLSLVRGRPLPESAQRGEHQGPGCAAGG